MSRQFARNREIRAGVKAGSVRTETMMASRPGFSTRATQGTKSTKTEHELTKVGSCFVFFVLFAFVVLVTRGGDAGVENGHLAQSRRCAGQPGPDRVDSASRRGLSTTATKLVSCCRIAEHFSLLS